MKSPFNPVPASRVLVRAGFTEDDIWRAALGGAAPLLACATFGPLDATCWMPAGGMTHRGAPAVQRAGAHA